MSFGRPNRALLISVIGTLVTAIGSVFLYQELIGRHDRPDSSPQLQYGDHGVVFRHRDGGCAGWFAYELYYDGAYSFVADGEIFTLWKGKSSSATFRGGVSFNSLNQLAGASLRMTVLGTPLSIDSSGVHPLRVQLRSEVAGKSVGLTREIPGPIEMYETKPGNFVLRSEALTELTALSEKFLQGKTALPSFLSGAVEPVPLSATGSEKDGRTEKERVEQACDERGRQPILIDEYEKSFGHLRGLTSMFSLAAPIGREKQ
ncbi:hypothetical protein MRY87_05600 [bacterium]|nr:hypothetical protein [bacterium]